MLLPKKVGSFTLMRKLDADGMTESYVGILDDPAGQQVVARRILPVVARDPGRLAQLRARIGDLRATRHPSLVPVLDLVEADGDLYILEEWTDGTELRAVLDWCAATRTVLPHNVYLNLATQVCNALEALHSRPGTESGSENVLHLALSPSAMWVTADGKVTVGRYGLARSPTAIATQATGSMAARVEYLAPEQTHQDQKLTPASDIFALGSILYELLTLKPMFKADSHLQTIHRVRRAEVTTQLLEVKEILQGLDKVLFRALSLNPRHRYQRAFVLREDLRGLMAGYTFADIDENTRAFLAPILKAGIDGYVESADDRRADDVSGPLGDDDRGDGAEPDSTAFLLGQGRDDDDGRRLSVEMDTADGAPIDSDTDALLDSQSLPPYEPDRQLDEDTDRPEEIEASDPVPRPSRMPSMQPLDLEPPGAISEETNLTPIQRTAWIQNRPTLVPQDFEDDLGRAPLESVDTGRPQRPDTGPFVDGVGLDAPSRPGIVREPSTDLGATGGQREDTDALLLDPSGFLGRGDTAPPEPTTIPTPEPEQREDTGPTPLSVAPPPRAQRKPPAEDEDDDWPELAPIPKKDLRKRLQPPDALRSPDATPAPPIASGQGRPVASRAPVQSPPTPPPAQFRAAALPAPVEPEPDEEAGPASILWMPAVAVGVAAVTLLVGLVCAGIGGGGVLGLLASTGGTREVAVVEPPPSEAHAEPPAPPEPVRPVEATAVPPAPLEREAVEREGVEREAPEPVRVAEPRPSPSPREAVASHPTDGSDLREPRPVPRPPAPPPPQAPRETWEAVAAMVDPAADEVPLAVAAGELDAWSTDAFGGQLGPDAKARLLNVAPEDPGFTRARTLLFLDAKAQGDHRARDQHLAAMMAVPENQYNPVLLVEEAQIAADDKDWERALARAAVAEQHWARLPSDLVYTRKALIYEIQAVAHTSMFYESQGEDLDRLALAIRGWERYRRHVVTKERPDLVGRADQNLDRLYEIQRRLQ